jgi:signal transduction histidine kinase
MWCLTESPISDGKDVAYVLHQAKEIGADGQGHRRISRWERRLLEMQENERHRIARELHDQTSQGLAALMLGLEGLKGQPQNVADVERLQELVEHLGHEVHRLTWDLRPAPIEQLGFRNALERLVEELLLCSRCQIYFYCDLPAGVRFDPQVETVCYRIVQEGLTNIVRHAQASVAGVVVSRHEGCLTLIIEDDGAGFDTTAIPTDAEQRDHLGLRGMRERLSLIGGSLVVESAAGHGTNLYIRIPVEELGDAR